MASHDPRLSAALRDLATAAVRVWARLRELSERFDDAEEARRVGADVLGIDAEKIDPWGRQEWELAFLALTVERLRFWLEWYSSALAVVRACGAIRRAELDAAAAERAARADAIWERTVEDAGRVASDALAAVGAAAGEAVRSVAGAAGRAGGAFLSGLGLPGLALLLLVLFAVLRERQG